MDFWPRVVNLVEKAGSNSYVIRYTETYKNHYKAADLWTYETGCLVFTSLIIYSCVLGDASGETTIWDKIVTILFILGALTYIALSSFFRKLSRLSENNTVLEWLRVANKSIFVILSFFPGIYFALQYDEVILGFYKVVHVVTTIYFIYKRLLEFQLVPFLIGLAMSLALGSINPSIRFFFGLFGSGWFATGCSTTLETIVNLSIAISFMLRLPEKYLPSTMIFGLKIVKYLMIFFSWKTFFILMVITSWKNIGAGVKTALELNLVNGTFKNSSKIEVENDGKPKRN